MELEINYVRTVSANDSITEGGHLPPTDQDSVEILKARIAELELQLNNVKKAAEKGERLLRVIRGDDFNDESLH